MTSVNKHIYMHEHILRVIYYMVIISQYISELYYLHINKYLHELANESGKI